MKKIIFVIVIIALLLCVALFGVPLTIIGTNSKTVSKEPSGSMTLDTSTSIIGQYMTVNNISITNAGFNLASYGDVSGQLYFKIYDAVDKQELFSQYVTEADTIKGSPGHGVWTDWNINNCPALYGEIIIAVIVDNCTGDGEIQVTVHFGDKDYTEYMFWYPGHWASVNDYDVWYKITYQEIEEETEEIVEDVTEPVGGDTDTTPEQKTSGFELLSLLGAIGVAFIVLRRK